MIEVRLTSHDVWRKLADITRMTPPPRLEVLSFAVRAHARARHCQDEKEVMRTAAGTSSRCLIELGLLVWMLAPVLERHLPLGMKTSPDGGRRSPPCRGAASRAHARTCGQN